MASEHLPGRPSGADEPNLQRESKTAFDPSYRWDMPDNETLRFTIDGFEPEHTWTAKRFGRDWNGWATPIVDRETLEAVVAATEEEAIRYIENIAMVDGSSIKPDEAGNYDLGLLGWCFIEVPNVNDGRLF